MRFLAFKRLLLVIHSIVSGVLVMLTYSVHGLWQAVAVFVAIFVMCTCNYMAGVMKGEGKA